VAAGHVLITTYSGTRLNQEVMCEVDWEYAVLDEGDKIRNPDADITLACKRLRVPSTAFSWHHMTCFFLAEGLMIMCAAADAPPLDPDRFAHSKQPDRAMVAVRLCLSWEAWGTTSAPPPPKGVGR
jgi:hypothetical protein